MQKQEQFSEIEKVLDEYIRPRLSEHGGNMLIEDYKDGILKFRLTGMCAGCPSAYLTTEELIKTELNEHMPEIKDVVLVQQVSDELIEQARRILKKHHV